MPTITLEGPPIKDISVKRKLIKELTEAAVKGYMMPPQSIIVLIKENPPENVGIGGLLILDQEKT